MLIANTYTATYVFTLREGNERHKVTMPQPRYRRKNYNEHWQAIKQLLRIQLCPLGAVERVQCDNGNRMLEINPFTGKVIK